jgi:TetR/AcrR family transcriptional regulator
MTTPQPESAAGADADLQQLQQPRPRARPRPGERRMQILRMLAQMLEQPHPERITTAALAAQLGVSEAALYRHFASKAQMYEGLLEYIEQSVLTRLIQLQQRRSMGELGGLAPHIVDMVLQFGQHHPGLARIMTGDALVHENDRLQTRMTQFFEQFERTLEQALNDAVPADPLRLHVHGEASLSQVQAALLTDFVLGRLQRYVRSGFKRLPCDDLQHCLQLLAGAGGGECAHRL